MGQLQTPTSQTRSVIYTGVFTVVFLLILIQI